MDESRKEAQEDGNIMNLSSSNIPNCNDEALAATALASLTYGSFQGLIPSSSSTEINKHTDTTTAKPVNKHGLLLPYDPTFSLVMNPYYTDYSVILESDLAILAQFEEDSTLNGALTACPRTIRTLWEQHLNHLKRIFGDLGPTRKNSGGVLQPFPEKLMEVLDQPNLEHIICWMPHGRAFIVNSPQSFVKEVLPLFFKQSKFMSFTRQLNLWGFKRLTRGMDNGAYYHPLFLRGRPLLCMKMKRQKVKVNGSVKMNTEVEPNFYDASRIRFLPLVSETSKNERWSSMLSSSTPPAVSFNVPSLYPPLSSASYSLLPGTNTGTHPNRFCQIPPPTSQTSMMYSNSMHYYSSADVFSRSAHIHSQAMSSWGHSVLPQHRHMLSLWTNNAPHYYNTSNSISRPPVAREYDQNHADPCIKNTDKHISSDLRFHSMAPRSIHDFSQQMILFP